MIKNLKKILLVLLSCMAVLFFSTSIIGGVFNKSYNVQAAAITLDQFKTALSIANTKDVKFSNFTEYKLVTEYYKDVKDGASTYIAGEGKDAWAKFTQNWNKMLEVKAAFDNFIKKVNNLNYAYNTDESGVWGTPSFWNRYDSSKKEKISLPWAQRVEILGYPELQSNTAKAFLDSYCGLTGISDSGIESELQSIIKKVFNEGERAEQAFTGYTVEFSYVSYYDLDGEKHTSDDRLYAFDFLENYQKAWADCKKQDERIENVKYKLDNTTIDETTGVYAYKVYQNLLDIKDVLNHGYGWNKLLFWFQETQAVLSSTVTTTKLIKGTFGFEELLEEYDKALAPILEKTESINQRISQIPSTVTLPNASLIKSIERDFEEFKNADFLDVDGSDVKGEKLLAFINNISKYELALKEVEKLGESIKVDDVEDKINKFGDKVVSIPYTISLADLSGVIDARTYFDILCLDTDKKDALSKETYKESGVFYEEILIRAEDALNSSKKRIENFIDAVLEFGLTDAQADSLTSINAVALYNAKALYDELGQAEKTDETYTYKELTTKFACEIYEAIEDRNTEYIKYLNDEMLSLYNKAETNTLTSSDITLYNSLVDQYNALDKTSSSDPHIASQQSLVTVNYEKMYNRIQAMFESISSIEDRIRELANNVDLSNNIGITQENKNRMESIKADFNKLSEGVKALVNTQYKNSLTRLEQELTDRNIELQTNGVLIVFLDSDKSEIDSKKYVKGETIEIPKNPEKKDPNIDYIFNYWELDGVRAEIDKAEKNATYIAVYKEIPKEYTIIFEDQNGNELSNKKYKYGETVVPPETPKDYEDDSYKYTFDSWLPAVGVCSGNQIYTAKYRKIGQDCMLIFKDHDGTTIETKICKFGVNIIPPVDPKGYEDNVYRYIFNGWSPSIGICAGNQTYIATYRPVDKEYTVIFKDYDEKTLATDIYGYGEVVVVPNNPIGYEDNTYTYTFDGWAPSVVPKCEGDATYVAQYKKEYREYTVIFLNYNGEELSKKNYHYGDKVEVPDMSGTTSDMTYIYSFKSWDKQVVNCAGNATYKAQGQATFIEYSVEFYDYDGETLLSQEYYHFGDEIKFIAEPKRENNETYKYFFTGWSRTDKTCTGDMQYVAMYYTVTKELEVVFKDYDGRVIYRHEYKFGDQVVVPTNVKRASDNTYNYKFIGWDKEIEPLCIESNEYTAQYEQEFIDYTIVFKNYDGSIISSKTYHYGDEIEIPATPSREANIGKVYTFNGWDKDVKETCESNEEYIAQYSEEYIEYTVVFKNYDGSVISSKNYHYGDKIEDPATITKPTRNKENDIVYTFVGWDKPVKEFCDGDETYTAKYSEESISVPSEGGCSGCSGSVGSTEGLGNVMTAISSMFIFFSIIVIKRKKSRN